MSLPPALQPADEIWSELRRHLEWSAGFSLVFLFGRRRALAHVRSRLIEALRFRSLFLQVVAPADANTAPEDVLNAVLRPPPGVDDSGAPVWIELERSPDDPAWNQARSRVLALLNERRYLLERDVRRPMILALPVDYRRAALEIAPDLWHVRSFSAAVGEAPVRSDRDQLPIVQEREGVAPATLREPSGAPLPAVLEWDRVKGSDPWRVSLASGAFAVEEAERAGDISHAHRVAREVVEIARLRMKNGNLPPGAAERELSVSLNDLGDAARVLGRLEEAEQAYREALELRRRVLAIRGETPEALRDVSLSLGRVGDVARVLGRLEEAEQVYCEGLELARGGLTVRGETSEALRDVSVLLDRVGDVARALGRLEEAEQAYREGLELDAGGSCSPMGRLWRRCGI